ncbi:MAG: tRNA pseudouridine(13) synthase TruD [Nanoarchaeota archaeon]
MLIKQIPEDFVVEELIDLELNENGEQTYFWLTKKNWTTGKAVSTIAQRCHTSMRRFKFAGNKDRNAITKQAISAFKISPEQLKRIMIKDIEINVIGKGNIPISLGTLRGNHFTIIVRDLKAKVNSKKLAKLKSKGFPNYFGEQRFGYGNTHLVGKEILKGNLEEAIKLIITYSEGSNKDTKIAKEFALKNWGNWKDIIVKFPHYMDLEKAVLNWLIQHPTDFGGALRVIPKTMRRMYVHAYQSEIWNKALEKCAPSLKGNPELPIPGTDTKLSKDKFSKAIVLLLKKEKVTLQDFSSKRIPELSSEGTERKAFVKPKTLKIGKLEKDELNKGRYKTKITFSLDKGAYATELIKYLFS